MDPEHMSEDQLTDVLSTNGFEDDEIKVLFPTIEKLREAVTDVQKLRKAKGSSEDALGWDSVDKTQLTASQRATTKDRREHREKAEKRLKEIDAAKAKLQTQELKESLGETKAPVTEQEVKSTMDDIKKLLSEDDD